MQFWLKRKSPERPLLKGSLDNIADINPTLLKFWRTLLSFPQRLALHWNSVVKSASVNPLALSVADAFIGELDYAVCGHLRPADAIKHHPVRGRRCRQVRYWGTSPSRNRHAVERSVPIPGSQHDDRCQWAILIFEGSYG